jgi:hypothetical protein
MERHHIMTRYLPLIAALAAAPVASAAESPRPIASLKRLVGTWKGTGTMAMGKDKAKVDASYECKLTSGESGVACSLRMTGVPGVAVYEESDLFGYEPNSSTYHWFAVTNAGETHDHAARPPAGGLIHWVYTGLQDGKPFKEVVDMEIANDDSSIAVHAVATVAGALVSTLDVKIHK